MKRLLVLGPSPAQATSVDVLAAQALAAARALGVEVVVVTSSPGTLLADPHRASRTYLEPLTVDVLERVLAQEKPDAVLTAFGGRALVHELHTQGRLLPRWLDPGAPAVPVHGGAVVMEVLAGAQGRVLGAVERVSLPGGAGAWLAGPDVTSRAAALNPAALAAAKGHFGLVGVVLDAQGAVVGVRPGAGASTLVLAHALGKALGAEALSAALPQVVVPAFGAPRVVLAAESSGHARSGPSVEAVLRPLATRPQAKTLMLGSPATQDNDWALSRLVAEAKAQGLSPMVLTSTFSSAAALEGEVSFGELERPEPSLDASVIDVRALGGAAAAKVCRDWPQLAAVAEKAGLQVPAFRGAAEGFRAAGEALGYPLVLRFASGDVELAWEEAQVERLHRSKGPVVRLERFLAQAAEVDVAVLRDAKGAVRVAAIAEHVETTGIAGQDVGCLSPPHSLTPEVVERVTDAAQRLAEALGAQGLLQARFAVVGRQPTLLGAWAHPTWLTSFLSRASGLDLPALGLRAALGQALVVPSSPERRTPAAREAVLDGSAGDVLLGLEARSHAEVMALGDTAAEAFGRSQRAAGLDLARRGTALLALAEADHPSSVDLVKRLRGLGFEVVVDDATAAYLGAKRHVVASSGGREVELVRGGAVGFFVNTVGRGDESRLVLARLEAVTRNVPWFTTIEAARLAVAALEIPQASAPVPLQLRG